MIVEIGELDAFTKAEANTIKRIISSSTDRFREPYARHPRDYPRNCILVGTTNEDSYLKDSTGGRRFWPIAISDIKLDMIQRDREQLFAEAVQLFKKGVKWHEVPVEAREIQESRRESDPWEVFISDYLNPRQATMMNEVRLQDIISDALDTDPDKMSMMQLRRIGKIMRMLGWRKKTARREGQLMKIWIKPETSGADNAH
jgi:predicted P-loop ATPase